MIPQIIQNNLFSYKNWHFWQFTNQISGFLSSLKIRIVAKGDSVMFCDPKSKLKKTTMSGVNF